MTSLTYVQTLNSILYSRLEEIRTIYIYIGRQICPWKNVREKNIFLANKYTEVLVTFYKNQ